jgi:predicted XRE-type DNA-binding protein
MNSLLKPVKRKMNRRSKMTEEIKVYSGSGNVFADLGLPNPDELLIKAKLAHQISELISERQLTQIEAAELLGIDQPKVSALVRGKLSGFSIERLFRFLNALGSNVEIRVIPNLQPNIQAQTRVVVVYHQK